MGLTLTLHRKKFESEKVIMEMMQDHKGACASSKEYQIKQLWVKLEKKMDKLKAWKDFPGQASREEQIKLSAEIDELTELYAKMCV